LDYNQVSERNYLGQVECTLSKNKIYRFYFHWQRIASQPSNLMKMYGWIFKIQQKWLWRE